MGAREKLAKLRKKTARQDAPWTDFVYRIWARAMAAGGISVESLRVTERAGTGEYRQFRVELIGLIKVGGSPVAGVESSHRAEVSGMWKFRRAASIEKLDAVEDNSGVLINLTKWIHTALKEQVEERVVKGIPMSARKVSNIHTWVRDDYSALTVSWNCGARREITRPLTDAGIKDIQEAIIAGLSEEEVRTHIDNALSDFIMEGM